AWLVPSRGTAGGPGPRPTRPHSESAAAGGCAHQLLEVRWQRRRSPPAENVPDKTQAEIIQLLKGAKLSIVKDEQRGWAIFVYLKANLAFLHGQLKNAEKLFKATMSYLLGGGMEQEDNAIIEISIKLASIYAAQSRQEFARAGCEFCISTLEEKMEREKELTEDTLSAQEKAKTHLLLGTCLDSYAPCLLLAKQTSQAQKVYEKALQVSEDIHGERDPQTVVLMDNLAFDEAFVYEQSASDLAKQIKHPAHMVLSNLAAILMHREQYEQVKETYQEALKQAELKSEISIQNIKKELAKLSRKSRTSI
uniref:Tetratricopeptide repeat protein 19, mitochondrial n=1 Tax=Loxodonta africana TaxID=9785 RepID=G3UNK6_LOXAF